MNVTLPPLSGLIMPHTDGTFTRIHEFEFGCIEAEFLHIMDRDHRQRIDVVAWEANNPGRWWLWKDIVTVVGEHELDRAWWAEEPARMLETPADYVAAHGRGFCIVDWTCDVSSIIGRVAAVECATPALQQRLEAKLIEQAMPRGLTISTKAAA